MVSDYFRETRITRSLSSSRCCIIMGGLCEKNCASLMIFRLNRTKVNERSGIYQWRPSLRSKRFQSSYCAKVGARTLHSSFLHLSQLSRQRKRLLCRLVRSRELRSRTGALFPFSPLQYASLPVTSRTWLPWRVVGNTVSGLLTQSSHLRPYSWTKGFRRIWRIKQISEGVIHLGLRPR